MSSDVALRLSAPGAGRRSGTGGAAAMVADRLGVLGAEVVSPPSELIERLRQDDLPISDAPITDIPMGRSEGGAYTNRDNKPDASCEVGIPAGVLYIVNRDYLIDEEKGVINVFCRFGNSTSGMPDSHTFRFIDGKIRGAHTLSVNLGTMPSPQADDNGAIVRAPAG